MSEPSRPARVAPPQEPRQGTPSRQETDDSGTRVGAHSLPHVDAQSPTLIQTDLPLSLTLNPVASESAGSARSSERQRLAGRYEILALVGSGGMGTVYRARDVELDEIVALKVMRPELLSMPGILERFRREAKLARRVTHRNVARVFDIGEDEHQRFLTMEFVEGEPLSAFLARDGAFGISRAVAVASAIAEGLGSAHAAGVVHRDLKPDNVIVSPDGRVVVTDFGIARALADVLGSPGQQAGRADTLGMFVGTPAYMAPEQVKGASDIGARADIYAFGALLFEMLTGARAWPGDAPLAVATARLIEPVPDPRRHRPGLPGELAELCVRCLAREPEGRPASMNEIVSLLSSVGTAEPSKVTTGAAQTPSAGLPQRSSPRTISSPGVGLGEHVAHAAEASRAGPRTDKTVAVLPFRNTGAPDDEYVAEELTDDLIDALSMTQGLRVRARGAVVKYRGATIDPREIGRELGVQVVVEGSVRRAGGHVRISARLVSVADGFQVWAKRFDRPEQEVLSINDEAARAIAHALTLEAAASNGRAAPSNPVAIDLYLRARHEFRLWGPVHQRRAIELFAEALAVAPDDPLLLSGSAMALARMSFFEGASVIPRAREAAERAVAAAPHLPEAQLALGSVAYQANDAVSAMRSYRAAVLAGPTLGEGHAALGRLLGEVGQIDEALRHLDTALSLTPDATSALVDVVRLHSLRGEWGRGEVMMDRLASLDASAYWTIQGRVLLWRRDEARLAEALARLPEGADLRYPRLLYVVAKTRQVPAEAFDLEREEAVGGVRRRSFVLQLSAEILGYCDRPAECLDAIGQAVRVGLIDLSWLERCPLLDAVRGSERYVGYLTEVRGRGDEILRAYRS